MARKNVFEGLMAEFGTEEPDQDTSPAAEDEVETARAAPIPEAFRRGPVAALENDIRSSASRSVQEIDPEQIEDTGMRDRFVLDGSDLDELKASIGQYGQQVPILLRPHPRLSGRYQVVYGRRRLAAIKQLGIPVKALIRTLSDEEAVLAQGQENNHRKDPSFIEKAIFAGDLEEAGYAPAVIRDALAVSKSHLSHMRKVRQAIPRNVIEWIGEAPGVGWKRWHALAEKLLAAGIDPKTIPVREADAALDSAKRFEAFARGVEARVSPPKTAPAQAQAVLAPGGKSKIGEVLVSGGRTVLRTDPKQKEFAQWLEANGAEALLRLHAEWERERTA
ncbi:plasmid partitioning protein RepB [Cribrihabitans pelagius]|uniref:plasmid partitioning protein RepB n=1 Tax=Cribrihabitans pelagius TaxID=1765746 RepID=UPI003B5C56F4